MNYLLETLLVSCIILVLLFFFLRGRALKKSFKYESNSSTNVDSPQSENEFLKNQLLKLQEAFKNEQQLISFQRTEFLKKEELLDDQLKDLEEKLSIEIDNRKKVLSQKKSSEVRLGHIAETLAPFLDQFDFDPENCNFLGKPIDYISFSDDEITFIEIKSGKSQLNTKQRHIRDLVKNKTVAWKEIRIQ
jgi:predicted Holliday junction resolvase-like endonuclease